MLVFFFFNDTATTEIYTLSLHDALPISRRSGSVLSGRRRTVIFAVAEARQAAHRQGGQGPRQPAAAGQGRAVQPGRSEEHTSELQSRQYLVCRLLLEKKKTSNNNLIEYE